MVVPLKSNINEFAIWLLFFKTIILMNKTENAMVSVVSTLREPKQKNANSNQIESNDKYLHKHIHLKNVMKTLIVHGHRSV